MGPVESGYSVEGAEVAPAPGPEDHRTFEELALPHLACVYRLAVRLQGNARDAEDAVQETYERALRAFPSLRQPDRIRPWLCRILSRLVVDRHRAAPREIAVGDLEELDRFCLHDAVWPDGACPPAATGHEDVLARFTDDDIRAALLALPESYRVPLVLLYTEEPSYRELAAMLGCPLGTVMSRLHRGRKLLERTLWECARRRGLIGGRRR